MADTDILVSEMTPASQINTTDLMIMTQPDAQAETGYSTKSGTVLQVANKMLKGTEYSTDLPDFTDKTPLGGLEELKADIKALLPISSASGNPCTFETNLADTLVSLIANITASGGNGTPSSPIPIVGHSELNLTRCGKNFLKLNTITSYSVAGLTMTPYYENGKLLYLDFDGTLSTTADFLISGVYNSNITFFSLNAGTYCFTKGTNNANIAFIMREGSTNIVNTSTDGYVHTFNATQNLGCAFYRCSPATYNHVKVYPQISLGSSSSDYAPYNGQTFTVSFGQTVYGGVYDANEGKVRITHAGTTLNGSENWWDDSGNTNRFGLSSGLTPTANYTTFKANYLSPSLWGTIPNSFALKQDGSLYVMLDNTAPQMTLAEFKTYLSNKPLQICYELATPIEIDVSELSVDTIVGVNNIVSDCGGDVEVQYRDSIQHYIDSKIASVQALIL